MEFSIDIHTRITGEIIIEDYSKEYGLYIDENLEVVTSYDSYKYSQCATINCITKVNIGCPELIDVTINKHTELLDSCMFRVTKDGYYVVDHIILPTIDWLRSASDEYKLYYETIYVTDYKKIYKLVEGNLEECSIEELMERNIEGTTIKKCKVEVFFTGHLLECYINHCKLLYNNLLNKCQPLDADTYARDFIWMTLNIIDYLIGFKLFMEAERILTTFLTCGGFCNDKKLHGRKSGSYCGCS